MTEEAKKELERIFGDRVAFHRLEAMLYSGDLSTLPEPLSRRVCSTPDAVVQPTSTDELTGLLNLAVKYRTPLTPRGAGTASYGGAVPTKGGIVIDFSRMKKIVAIDKEKKAVTVQPGIAWNELERALRSDHLALRVYPGSAISSTVGGWVGNGGGAGIGSFEYGYFRDSLLEVQIATPMGVRRLKGNQVDLVYGMAGTTGLISAVTFVARDIDDDIALLGAFARLDNLLDAVEDVKREALPLWEASYRNPLHVRMNRQAVEKQAKRAIVRRPANRLWLPDERFIATFAYPKSRESVVKERLLRIIKAHGGEALEEGLTRSAWDERFYPIRLRALATYLLLTEIILPAEKLLLLDGLSAEEEALAVTGTFIDGGRDAVVRIYDLKNDPTGNFSPADEKSFVAMDAVRKLGGRPYAVGMHFAGDAELILGHAAFLEAQEFKTKVDPLGLLNPGKVFALSPLEDNEGAGVRPEKETAKGNNVIERLPLGREVILDALTCANCGYCRSVCPQFETTGWESASPRGKFNFVREYLKGNAKFDERMAETFFVCTTCRRCDRVCQIEAPIDEDWSLTMRQAVLEEGFSPPLIFQRQAHNILHNHNPGGFPQAKREAWMTADLKFAEQGEICYFVGCAATFTYLLRNLPINAVRILNAGGIEPVCLGADEWCCGGPLFSIGFINEVLETIGHNIREMNKRGIKTVVTSCSGGWLYLNHFYRLLASKLDLEYNVTVKHMTEVMYDLIREGKIKCERPINLKITYHDPCHIGRGGGIFDPPREILASIPGLELVEMPRNREDSACCGKNIVRYPRLGGAINRSRVTEAVRTGASALVTCCPTCENNIRKGIVDAGAAMEVLDISDLVAESMGLPRLSASRLGRLLRK